MARSAEMLATGSVAAPALLGKLEACVDRLLAIPDMPPAPCRELQQKIASQTFNLVVAGEFKRGKTSAINALIGADLLPVGVIPLTSVVTILAYGEQPLTQVLFRNGESREVAAGQLWDYVTEKGNPKNVKGVREVHIAYPSPWLQGGVRLVDTPGIGSVYSHNTDETYRYLPQADAVLFLLSVDQPLGQTERDFLGDVGEYAGKIFFLLNKADLLSEADLRESLAFTGDILAEALGKAPNLFPVSARLALEGTLTRSDELSRRSRFPAFAEALNAFLMQERGNVLVGSIGRNLLRIISQARFGIELEQKSLAEPLDALRRKIDAFEAKKREVVREKNDYTILLEGETKRLLEIDINDDLEQFKMQFQREIRHSVEQHLSATRHLSSRELYKVLEQHVVSEVKATFERKRPVVEERATRAFDALCARFTTKINATVDELFNFSSALFAIPFDSVHAESLSDFRSRFFYKFWSEPPGLQTLISSTMFTLPRFIGHPWVLRKIVDYAQDSVEIQTGRLRYDLAQRLDHSVRAFKSVIPEKVDATIESIEGAVRKGVEMRRVNEKAAAERGRELLERLHAVAAIGDQVSSIVQTAMGTGTAGNAGAVP